MMTLEYFFLPRAKTPLLIAFANERGCTADYLLQEQLDRLNEDSAFSERLPKTQKRPPPATLVVESRLDISAQLTSKKGLVHGGSRHAIAPDASCLNFNFTRRFGLKQQAGTIRHIRVY
jgi:hypothetical protein